jgi:small subunit ribosomal protein S4
MTKRINTKHKISRRYGVNLWGRDNDPSEKRNFIPGQHGPSIGRRVMSDFGKQLAAKQTLKGYYGNVSEKQFRNIYKEAIARKGDTSENFVGLLESRLDVVVYRMNFVPTIFASRQFVNHKHVTVNGKTVNIPSYKVKAGDVIEVKEASKQIPIVIEATEGLKRPLPDYIEADLKARKGKFIRKPIFSEVPFPFKAEVNLVIEFYSR